MLQLRDVLILILNLILILTTFLNQVQDQVQDQEGGWLRGKLKSGSG